MSKTLGFMVDNLPAISAYDLDRFSGSVEIRDAGAFARELQAFMRERVAALELSEPTSSANEPSGTETVEQVLARKAGALRAGTRWAPAETDIQRSREVLLAAFDQPHNLPLPEFARLARKSRQQIYKDIEARRLLALNVGRRGRRLPDWQLDPVKQQLTRAVLQRAEGVDDWTLCRALSEPLEGLDGRSPVEAVSVDCLDRTAEAVFNVLGIH